MIKEKDINLLPNNVEIIKAYDLLQDAIKNKDMLSYSIALTKLNLLGYDIVSFEEAEALKIKETKGASDEHSVQQPQP